MKTAKTALHKLRSLFQGTSRTGIAALLFLGTSAFVAHEIQKEISIREDSAIQAGACFKVEEISRAQFLALTEDERAAWTPFTCKGRGWLEPCSEPKEVYYKECPYAGIKRCASGGEFRNCVDYRTTCPVGTRIVECTDEGGTYKRWFEREKLPNGAVLINDCTTSYKIGIAFGSCPKQ